MPIPGAIPSRPSLTEETRVGQELVLHAAINSGNTTELEPLIDSPAMNRLLLKNARKSPAQISQITGIPVGEVAERLEKLLNSTSLRDDLMEEKLLLAEIAMQVEDIRERTSRIGIDDEAWASMQRVQLAATKTMLDQLDKRRKAVDGKLSLLSFEQAKLFAETINTAHTIMMQALAVKYPDLDPEIIYAEWSEALPVAIQQLENQVER